MPALNDIRVLVAAGGTGGHLTPALAVADELTARGALVTFVTTPSQLERVAERFPAYALAMRGFERRLLARENAVTLWRLAAAAPRSWGIVSAARPHGKAGSQANRQRAAFFTLIDPAFPRNIAQIPL